MSDDKTKDTEETLSPEEQTAEEQALKETSDGDLKQTIIDELGLDEEVDEEVINKVVEHRKGELKKLSTAIRQKQDWRTKAQANAPKEEPKVEPKVDPKPEPKPDQDIDKMLDKKLRERDLQSFDASEELQKEIDVYAALKPELSAKEVYNSRFVQSFKDEEESKVRTEEAGISNTHKTKTSRNFSEMTPNDFDRSTSEGRKEYSDWKVWMKSQ